MAIEIVDLPIKNGDVSYFFVCLPEGIPSGNLLQIAIGKWFNDILWWYIGIEPRKMGDINEISSANLLRSYTTRPIDIVDLPMKK